MRKTLVTMIAAMATATLLTISASSAATYRFNFLSSDAELTATGEFTVNSANEVTGVSGAVAGLTNQAIKRGHRQSELPELVLQSRRLVHLRQPVLPHRHGLRLQRAVVHHGGQSGRLLESLASSPGTYSLYESAGGSYPFEESGTLSVAAAPEASTWAMLALGFVALTFIGRRRQRTARLAPALG
jgi:MYXO-CTERM domain-containing protein